MVLTTLNFTSRPLRRVRCSELLSFRVSALPRGEASRNEEKLGTRLGPAEFRGDRKATKQTKYDIEGIGRLIKLRHEFSPEILFNEKVSSVEKI